MSAAKTLTGHSDCEDVFAFSNSDAEVVLANISDYGNNDAEATQVADLVYSWRPDAIWTNGDNTYSTVYDYEVSIGGDYGEFVDRDLLWPCPGNHDWDDGDLGYYLDYFSGVVANRYYYKKIVGPVSIYLLDSNPETPDGNTTAGRQYEWFAADIAASRSPWNIASFHHSAYTSSDGHPSSEWMRWGFGALGVDAVFSGHNHGYERFTGLDTVYITNAGVGRPLRPFLPSPLTGSAVRYSTRRGAGKLVATPNSLTWQWHTYDGAMIDRLTLEQ